MYRLFLLLPLLVACSKQRDVRNYYFPVRELTDGLVYEYANKGTLTDDPSDFWYFLGIDRDTALYLSSTHYADGMAPDQVVRERITNEGVLLEQLLLYPPLINGQPKLVEVDILYARTFPFYPDDGAASGYRIAFTPPENKDAVNYISLNRRFRGDTTLTIMGEVRNAILFDLEGEVSQRDPELGDISPTYTGYEIYAEGLGLVEYSRNLGAGGTLAGKLVRRITMAEYAGKFEH
ncbi:hypothetical protein GGR28_002308 [Lewinella aquimaris]|uniref:Uncharacterized protein n=1 Tax=Neolewinella aquimaris TaxID=1835722 RepID=A0A840E6V7_9BACT|nr:hypothetical protein [Neolewinella aquimaris]MBB4079683.1 hypothetical protein [Neolewinella aquimaris]